MAGIGLQAAKAALQADVYNALRDAFKATFMLGTGKNGEQLAARFAQKGAPLFADAILKFVQQAQITGTLPAGVVTGACAVGPVSGSCVTTVSPTDLSLV